MDNEKRVLIAVSQEQADIIVRALDLYTRIGIGQFEEVLQVYDRDLKLDEGQREILREGLNDAKSAAGHPRNGSYGIHNTTISDDFRAAFDIQQVVRHTLAWNRDPKGGIQINFDHPRQISRFPLPTARFVEADGPLDRLTAAMEGKTLAVNPEGLARVNAETEAEIGRLQAPK